MSQLDVANAKRALAARLQMWGLDDPAKKADGFMEDLVAQGWVMSPKREARPAPPRRTEACYTCGYHLGSCICGQRTVRPPTPASDPAASAAAVRELLRGTK